MRKFTIIWLGETLSVFASGLTSFALGVWIYEQTESVGLLSLNILAVTLPYLLLSPLTGVLADRWNRKLMMVVGDTVAALSSVIVLGGAINGTLSVELVIATTALRGVGNAIQWPPYNASIAVMVPKEHLGRVGGMTQVGDALSFLLAPALAGALYGLPGVGIPGILFIDFTSYFLAVGTLLVVAIPDPVREEIGDKARSLWGDFREGIRYIMARPGLMYLMIFFALMNFLAELTNPLVQPLLLQIGTPAEMGRSLSLMALGMVIGIGLVSVWGGPKKRMYAILVASIFGGVSIALAGLRPSLVLITIAGFGYFVIWPVLEAMDQALWQSKVRLDYQGRILAARSAFVSAIRPLALVLAGPLADRVFEPAMMEGGALADSVGRVIGVGPGRGVALMILLVGVLTVVTATAAFLMPALRELEAQIPDATT